MFTALRRRRFCRYDGKLFIKYNCWWAIKTIHFFLYRFLHIKYVRYFNSNKKTYNIICIFCIFCISGGSLKGEGWESDQRNTPKIPKISKIPIILYVFWFRIPKIPKLQIILCVFWFRRQQRSEKQWIWRALCSNIQKCFNLLCIFCPLASKSSLGSCSPQCSIRFKDYIINAHTSSLGSWPPPVLNSY